MRVDDIVLGMEYPALLGNPALTTFGKIREEMEKLGEHLTNAGVKSIHTQYIAQLAAGQEPPEYDRFGKALNVSGKEIPRAIASRLSIPFATAYGFCRALYKLHSERRIDLVWYDPEEAKKVKEEAAALRPKGVVESLTEGLKTAGKVGGGLLLVAALAAGGYLLSQAKGIKALSKR